MSLKSSKTTEGSRADLPETITVGRILRPHGVRGEVVVEVLSDVPGRFAPGSEVLAAREGERQVTLKVAVSRDHKSGVVARFSGFDDRDGAESLRGMWLEVLRSGVPAAPSGTYYHYELLGCRCFTAEGELGRVVELLEDGGGLLLVVDDSERRVPIPFVQGFLRKVDVADGSIELDLPPGLLDVCASKS
jgi:16S rRNA processing protein RimM